MGRIRNEELLTIFLFYKMLLFLQPDNNVSIARAELTNFRLGYDREAAASSAGSVDISEFITVFDVCHFLRKEIINKWFDPEKLK